MPSQQSKQNRKSSWQALLCIAQSQAESGARDSSPASFSLSTVHVSVYPSWFGLTSIMELNVWVSIRYVKWFSSSSIWPNFVKKLRASRILWTLHTDLMVWQRIQNGELQVMQQICGFFFFFILLILWSVTSLSIFSLLRYVCIRNKSGNVASCSHEPPNLNLRPPVDLVP